MALRAARFVGTAKKSFLLICFFSSKHLYVTANPSTTEHIFVKKTKT